MRHFIFLLCALCLLGFAHAAPADTDPLLGAPLTLRLRPSLGPTDASLIVIEVRSFKCAHCRAFHENVFPTLRERYLTSGLVRWVTLNGTPDPADALAAPFIIARCALRHDSYATLEPFLFRHGNRSTSWLYGQAPAQAGEAADLLAACIRTGDSQAEVRADFAEIAALKVTVLPTFILRKRLPDGRFIETRIEGYPQADHFQRVMSQLQVQQ